MGRGTHMTRNTHSGSNERGAALVEYALLVALIAVVLIVSINFLGGKLGTTFAQASTKVGSTSALAASDTTGSGGTSGSGSAAGSGTTTTTNAAATTTSLPAATTTTTTIAATTTTTVAVTTTTTMAASGSGSGPVQGSTPDQSRTAAYKGEFQITFGASGDTISVTGVDAGDWTYKIIKNVDKKLKVKFTSADGDKVVLVEAKIDKRGKLKTKVKTLD
ncbi:hypothetical protein MNBD_ACTINO01-2291 [hydrothermal vent metagenome]|uniref:Flp family type IVb pilin n=1 Tax=hydrothermal vent metagenome TaxID=652676 RepID=A0A3B0TG11_9ZZZZ